MHRRCAGPIGIGQKVIVRETLPNGVKLIAQEMTGFRSVSMAVWIQAGSVYETGAESGISHFIEHMVFKGTESRSASDIAAEMDAVIRAIITADSRVDTTRESIRFALKPHKVFLFHRDTQVRLDCTLR